MNVQVVEVGQAQAQRQLSRGSDRNLDIIFVLELAVPVAKVVYNPTGLIECCRCGRLIRTLLKMLTRHRQAGLRASVDIDVPHGKGARLDIVPCAFQACSSRNNRTLHISVCA